MNYSIKHSNKSIFYLTLSAFMASWLLGFYGFRKHQDIDSTIILTILFFTILIIWNIVKNSFFRNISRYSFLVLLFFSFVTLNSLLRGAPVYEVFVATKPLILFILFFYGSGKVGLPLLSKKFAIQVMKITSCLMFVKYSISHVLSLNDRPFLFTENNFELVLPLGLLFCYREKSLGFTILLLVVILMSGSKSAIASVILLPIIAFGYTQNFLIKFFIALILLLVTASLIIVGAFDEVDRFIYLTSIISFYDLSVVNLLFGNFQISPLLSSACEAFNYMGAEKITHEDGKFVCYSRVANFTTIRLFIDFGIFFGSFFFFFWFINLKKLFPKYIAVNLFFIGVLNGLSVSGFGNIFYLVTILLMYSSFGRRFDHSYVSSKQKFTH